MAAKLKRECEYFNYRPTANQCKYSISATLLHSGCGIICNTLNVIAMWKLN